MVYQARSVYVLGAEVVRDIHTRDNFQYHLRVVLKTTEETNGKFVKSPETQVVCVHCMAPLADMQMAHLALLHSSTA